MNQTVIPAPMTFEQAMTILDKRHEDTLAKIEADKKLYQEQMSEFKKEMKNLSRRFGDLGNRLGDIIECIVAPNLQEKFKKYGFDFHNSSTHLVVKDGKKTITEIDVILEDGDCVMLVEVKTKPTIDDITKHIERMQKMQQHPTRATRGAKMYGAIACAMLEEEVKEEAFKSGFYLICQTGDNIDIVEPPDGFVAKYWDTKLK